MIKFKNLMELLCVVFITINLIRCQKEEISSSTNQSINSSITKSTSVAINVINPGNNNNIQPNIQTAINLAKNGDTINLPEGIFTFIGQISTSKRVSLKGKGIKKTILYRPETITDGDLSNKSIFRFDINYDSPSGMVISDFTLKSKIPSESNASHTIIKPGSSAIDYGISMNHAVDFVIRRVRFENFGIAAVVVRHKDLLARGLIYNCEFYHNYKYDGLSYGYGVAVYGENLQWVNASNFGSSNFIFIENNFFELHRHAVVAGGCGLYVARYNNIWNNLILNALDMHSAFAQAIGYPNHFSGRAAEAYNNNIINLKFKDGTTIPIGDSTHVYEMQDHAIYFYGGASVIHDNYISGYTNGIMLAAFTITSTKTTYPIAYQIGYSSGLKYGANHKGTDDNYGDGDSYIWKNSFHIIKKSSPGNIAFNTYKDGYNLLKEERDYHLSAKPGYVSYTYPHPLRTMK